MIDIKVWKEACDKLWDGVFFMKYNLRDWYVTGLPNCILYKRNSWLTLTVDNRIICSVKQRASYFGRIWTSSILAANYYRYITEN